MRIGTVILVTAGAVITSTLAAFAEVNSEGVDVTSADTYSPGTPELHDLQLYPPIIAGIELAAIDPEPVLIAESAQPQTPKTDDINRKPAYKPGGV